MKVALIIGHSNHSQGASNKRHKITEFMYNSRLVFDISQKLDFCEWAIVHREDYKSLPERVNSTKADLAISFHCNAYNQEVSGTETLYYHSSMIGKKIAKQMQVLVSQVLHLPNRGIKPKHTEDRGGYILRYTNMPCILTEPFFIDNDSDLEIANSKHKELVAAYVAVIRNTHENLLDK